jgi:hypothetical protein
VRSNRSNECIIKLFIALWQFIFLDSSTLFLRSPLLRRQQRVVGNISPSPMKSKQQTTITPFPVFVNLPPVDLPEGYVDVLPLITCFYDSFII